jgi:hypothetical protein
MNKQEIQKKFRITQGRKHKDDRILFYNEKPVSFEDVAFMMNFLMQNEDRVYNKPWHKGSEMMKEYFMDVLNNKKIPDKCKFMLGKKSIVKVDE